MSTGSRARVATGVAALMMLGAVSPAVCAQTPAQQAALAALIPVQAGVTLDHDSVTVGDVVRLTVRVRAPLGASVNFPVGLDSLGPVQSLDVPVVHNGADSASAADRIAVYRVAPWAVGPLPIRLGDVLVQTDDGERRVVLALPTLTVGSVLPADTTLRIPKPARAPIAPPIPIPWWWWAAAAAAALLIGFVFWWAARRRHRRAELSTGDPYADAERAFARIDTLGLVQAGEPGRHAALTADVLRRYLAARITGASLALTSGELLAALRGAPTVPYERLQRLLAAVDPVKFAAAPIAADDARALGAEAQAMVRAEHVQATARAAAAAVNTARGEAAA